MNDITFSAINEAAAFMSGINGQLTVRESGDSDILLLVQGRLYMTKPVDF